MLLSINDKKPDAVIKKMFDWGEYYDLLAIYQMQIIQ